MNGPWLGLLTTCVLLFAVTLSADDKQRKEKSDDHHYFAKTAHMHKAEWGYRGKIGPKFWGSLDPSWKLAASGKRQSPINIETNAKRRSLPQLKFDYKTENLSAINNGHTIQHNEAPGSFLTVAGKRYALEQFHVHTPSEHTFDGKHFPMEVHFVHRSKLGEVAVVAVMVEVGESAQLNLPLYKRLPKKGQSVSYQGRRNPADFLPKDRGYFEYSGSFTTPPCTEGVRWFVLKTPVQKTARRIQEFADILQGNNRPVQPRNGRAIATPDD